MCREHCTNKIDLVFSSRSNDGFLLLGGWLDRIVYNDINQENSFECRILRFQYRYDINEFRIMSDATGCSVRRSLIRK
jgi:hypothetical protein